MPRTLRLSHFTGAGVVIEPVKPTREALNEKVRRPFRQRLRRRKGRRTFSFRASRVGLTGSITTPAPVKWLNRNVLGIGLADLAADANYEMIFAVLPLFITVGLGAPAFAVGLIEGIGDGSSAVVKLWSGWYSDRISWRRRLAAGGYGTTVIGLGVLVAITSWPQ